MSEPSTVPYVLYVRRGCPWCARVRVALRDLNLTVPEREVTTDPEAMGALRAATGRGTAPVLHNRRDGDWLPESGDIVDYLYRQHGGGRPPSLLTTRVPVRGAQGVGFMLAAAGLYGGSTGLTFAGALLIGLSGRAYSLIRVLQR
ncbi:MAG: glutathione S-transferase N-terminal domain-containing protein [Myxococcota bacterium]